MLYHLKKSAEALYYKHCISQGKLPLPDLIYYHWDKRKLTKELIMLHTNKERSPRKEKKKPKKEKR